MDFMKVYCELREVKKNNAENLPEGKHLFAHKENNPHVIISLSEFQVYFNEAKRGSENSIQDDPGYGKKEQPVILSENNRPNFKKMMNFLAEKIVINDNDFNNDKDELIIESSFGNFLELPWEEITQKKIFVFRRVIGDNKNNYIESKNNLLFVISNSNMSTSGDLPDIRDKLKEEILNIFEQIIDVEPKYFKINNLSVSKHTTRNSFLLLPWNNYNYVHIIMHGDENGGLCLEKQEVDQYKTQDIMTLNEAIEVLRNNNFLLLFLSFCHSGSCLGDNDSLAFQITNKGIAKYVIGYRYGIGERSASVFAEKFYKTLCAFTDRQEKIEEIYKKSLSEYYKDPKSDNKYVPILYINS